MAGIMVERDAVMAALHGLMGEALEGRGGALFVAGEAGLGKTTVLEHAATIARGRFKTGIGRADVAEAALPFGLISQALEALLDGPAWLTDPADRGNAGGGAGHGPALAAGGAAGGRGAGRPAAGCRAAPGAAQPGGSADDPQPAGGSGRSGHRGAGAGGGFVRREPAAAGLCRRRDAGRPGHPGAAVTGRHVVGAPAAVVSPGRPGGVGAALPARCRGAGATFPPRGGG